MPVTCPFSSVDYLRGLSNIGEVDKHPDLPYAVLRRKINGDSNFDGVGPWPYRWITKEADIGIFTEGFRHLVSLSVVTQPGWKPSSSLAAKADIRKLKEHFVFDPKKPTPELSKRARKRLRDAGKCGYFETVNELCKKLEIVDYYEQLKIRRNLTDSFFDMPRSHFESISKLPGSVFFRVSDSIGVGAMACAVVIDDFLQVLHIVPTENGLTWNASYLMMYGLQRYVREKGLLLLTGGMPDNGSKGLIVFKSRWANTFLPVYMLCIVNSQDTVNILVANNNFHSNYFPPYRYAK